MLHILQLGHVSIKITTIITNTSVKQSNSEMLLNRGKESPMKDQLLHDRL